MRGCSVGKRLALAGALCVVLVGGHRGMLQADERSGGGSDPRPEVAEVRSRVKELEGRVRAAEAELGKVKELLASIEAAPAQDVGAEKDDTGTLEGVWRIVSIGGNREGGTFVKPPYDEYKIMTAGHYLWLSFNPETGAVLRSGGGTYALKDGVYTAHVDYSNATDLRAVTGLEYKGTCRLDGKRWYHYGKMTNGAVFDELWERVH
jgi:hypothetical protein